MSNTFGPETPTQTLTQKEKHTQNSSLDQTHSKALFFFFLMLMIYFLLSEKAHPHKS